MLHLVKNTGTGYVQTNQIVNINNKVQGELIISPQPPQTGMYGSMIRGNKQTIPIEREIRMPNGSAIFAILDDGHVKMVMNDRIGNYISAKYYKGALSDLMDKAGTIDKYNSLDDATGGYLLRPLNQNKSLLLQNKGGNQAVGLNTLFNPQQQAIVGTVINCPVGQTLTAVCTSNTNVKQGFEGFESTGFRLTNLTIALICFIILIYAISIYFAFYHKKNY